MGDLELGVRLFPGPHARAMGLGRMLCGRRELRRILPATGADGLQHSGVVDEQGVAGVGQEAGEHRAGQPIPQGRQAGKVKGVLLQGVHAGAFRGWEGASGQAKDGNAPTEQFGGQRGTEAGAVTGDDCLDHDEAPGLE